jgi:hypothetical protein
VGPIILTVIGLPDNKKTITTQGEASGPILLESILRAFRINILEEVQALLLSSYLAPSLSSHCSYHRQALPAREEGKRL